MAVIRHTRTERDQIAREVEHAIAQLGPEVVRVRYRVGEDWDGDPAIYFRVVLTDEASGRENLFENARKVENTLLSQFRARED
jgi:hypothetical protein